MADVFVPGVQVIVESPEQSGRSCQLSLLGNKKGRFLILEHPEENGGGPILKEKDLCRLRILENSGRTYEFETEVLAVVPPPVGVMFLAYPRSFTSPPPRLTSRHAVEIETYYAREPIKGQMDGCAQGMMLNVSKGGCLLEAEEPFLPANELFLTFTLPEYFQVHEDLIVSFPDHSGLSDLEATVRHCQEKEGRYSLGLEFQNTVNEKYSAIRNFVDCLESFRPES